MHSCVSFIHPRKRKTIIVLQVTDQFDEDDSTLDYVPRAARARKAPPRRKWTEFSEGEQVLGTVQMTYQPARYEEVWLRSSLRDFFTQQYITDVLAQVKGGKEASVYRCAAAPHLGTSWLAAKVYRPRMFRNLRNDAMYREGRAVLTEKGTAAKKTDHRLMRAIGKKTEFGMQAAHTSWLMYEFVTLQKLFAAGASVPQPIAAGENAILMAYRGDGNRAAPTLGGVALTAEEAPRLFDEVVRNIRLLLEIGYIHGDLSAYNILYWEGEVTLIDFPQVTEAAQNPNAAFILGRDITRVCDYFARYGVDCDAQQLTADLWREYVSLEHE
jgi:RIO kinase 1